MWTVAVVVVELVLEPLAALLRGGIAGRVGPLTQRYLDEALGLAVGMGRLGAGIGMAQLQAPTGVGKVP